MLVFLWCFVCLHVQECQGWACPSNIAGRVLHFVILSFLLYPIRMVMAGGDDGQAGCSLHSTIHDAFGRR